MPDVTFRVTVEGAAQGAAEVDQVRQALGGVSTSLDASAVASRVYGVSQDQVTEAQKQAAISGSSARVTVTSLGSALQQGKATGLDPFADSTRKTHQELFEAARLGRSFLDTLGQAVPGLAAATGGFTRLGRETHGFSVAEVAATAAMLGGAMLIGKIIELESELITTQAQANKAVAGMDFSAAEAGLTKIVDKVMEVDLAQQTLAARSFTDSGFAGFGAWAVKIKNMFSDSAAQAKIWADAMEMLWEVAGRGKATLEANKAELEAQGKAIDNMIASAGSMGVLSDAYAQQEANVRAVAQATIDLKKIQDTAALATALNEATVLQRGVDAAAGIAKRNIALEEFALKQRQRTAEEMSADQAAIALKEANAKKQAEFIAKEIEDRGKLSGLAIQGAAEAVKAGQAEVDARFAAAKANADFFGVTLTGLTTYQAARTVSIEQQAALEKQEIQARYDAERAAQLARIAALPEGGMAQQAEYRKLEIMDAETNGKLAKADDDLRLKRIENLNKIDEERKAAYARNIALTESTYKALEGLGQGNVQAHLAFLAKEALDENLSKQQQLAYAKQYYDGVRAFDQSQFDLRKALGVISQTEEVARLRDMADKYAATSKERLDAETKFVEGVKSLWDSMAKTGKSAWDLAAQSLKDNFGIVDATLPEITAEWERMKGQTRETIAAMAAGTRVLPELRTQAEQVATAQAEMTKQGVTFGQVVPAYVQDMQDKLDGTRNGLDAMGGAFTAAGAAGQAAFGGVGDAAGKISTAIDPIPDAIDRMIEAGRQWNKQWWEEHPAGEGGGMMEQFRNSFPPALGAIDDFYEQASEKIRSGNSRLSDLWAGGLIERLKQELDALALSS